jgi:hypothetical protein
VISSLTRVGDVNGHIDELWLLAYRIGMIDKIPAFDDKKLSAIEENANRLLKVGNDKQRANAENVLAAIVAERQRRKDAAADRRKQHVADVADKVRDKGLLDRVLLASTEIPPEQWEAKVLKEIASNPGRDGSAIARAIGKKDVGYINLAVGGLCRTRETLRLSIGPTAWERAASPRSMLCGETNSPRVFFPLDAPDDVRQRRHRHDG